MFTIIRKRSYLLKNDIFIGVTYYLLIVMLLYVPPFGNVTIAILFYYYKYYVTNICVTKLALYVIVYNLLTPSDPVTLTERGFPSANEPL